MKKLSLIAAIYFLMTPYTFAATTDTTEQPQATPDVAQTVPVDAVDISDSEVSDTSPITDTDAATENESLVIDTHYKAVPKSDHDENTEYHYTIDVTYPQIAGDTLSPAAQQFNQTINKMVSDQVEQFKNNVKFDSAHMNTLPEDVRKNSFKMDYDIDVIKPDAKLAIVSVRLSIESMQAGRPHPLHAYQVLNFDLTNGKTLALTDLFKKHANYLTTIATYSNKKLNESLQDKWLIADGTKADLKNYKNWNLQADSILITFDEYQVAPYVDGPQEIEIPLTELAKVLSANAPVMAEYKPKTITNKANAIAINKDEKKSVAKKNIG